MATKANRLPKFFPRTRGNVKLAPATGIARYGLGSRATETGILCYGKWDRVLSAMAAGLGSRAIPTGILCYANPLKPLVCLAFPL